jgi:hypothetical protein
VSNHHASAYARQQVDIVNLKMIKNILLGIEIDNNNIPEVGKFFKHEGKRYKVKRVHDWSPFQLKGCNQLLEVTTSTKRITISTVDEYNNIVRDY